MRVERTPKVQPRLRVTHPVNSDGTTWLKDSDLLFVNKRPVAVFSWRHGAKGDIPEVSFKLNRKLLSRAGAYYRYEGALPDPRSLPKAPERSRR
jgi:hypothetical protein